MSSEGEPTPGEPKPLDVQSIIEAKRQRMAGRAPSARQAAEEKAAEVAAESARQAAAEREQKIEEKRKELLYERIAREHEEKKRHAAILREVTLVPIDEEKPIHADTAEELDAKRPRSSRRRRKRSSRAIPRGSRASRTVHARGRGGGGGGGAVVVLGILAAVILVGGLLIALMN